MRSALTDAWSHLAAPLSALVARDHQTGGFASPPCGGFADAWTVSLNQGGLKVSRLNDMKRAESTAGSPYVNSNSCGMENPEDRLALNRH